ncbi:MAG: DUF190 domain-containing protein [Enhydrobacter sp.]|nr:MAG: DUF190 domain-containing protein [Enhydrobacter sp.]
MKSPKPARRLRVLISEAARHDGAPLYEAIVLKAREMGLAGATVTRAALGYGHSGHLRTSKILRLSDDLPLIVEIIDTEEKVDAFLPVLDGMMGTGLVTLEAIEAMVYRDAPAS